MDPWNWCISLALWSPGGRRCYLQVRCPGWHTGGWTMITSEYSHLCYYGTVSTEQQSLQFVTYFSDPCALLTARKTCRRLATLTCQKGSDFPNCSPVIAVCHHVYPACSTSDYPYLPAHTPPQQLLLLQSWPYLARHVVMPTSTSIACGVS